MSVWHGDFHKRKPTGGRKRSYREKRRFERGGFPAETVLGEPKTKISRRHGGNIKVRLLASKWVNVSDPSTGKVQKTEIIEVTENPANIDYDRRGVITKGALVETSLGTVRILSRPGQSGVLNGEIVQKER